MLKETMNRIGRLSFLGPEPERQICEDYEDGGWIQPSFSVVSALEAWYIEREELREE